MKTVRNGIYKSYNSFKCVIKLSLVFLILLINNQYLKAQFTKLHDFDSASCTLPLGSVLLQNDTLYGIKSGGGCLNYGHIFKININGSGYELLHEFSISDGFFPNRNLIISGNILYGLTESGGTYNKGAMFKINIDGSDYNKLYDFIDSMGYGPSSDFILVGDSIYGSTQGGGKYGYGVIFRIAVTGTEYSKLYELMSYTDGAYPVGSLILKNNILYGCTQSGGIYDYGTIFRIWTNGTGYTKLLDLTKETQANAAISLIVYDSLIYGISNSNGEKNGIVFQLKIDGSGYKVVKDLDSTNAKFYAGKFILDGNKLIITANGGANDKGMIFKINTDGTGFKTLYDLKDTDGVTPYGKFVLSDNDLYGMTWKGGISNTGTVFKYSIQNETFIFGENIAGNNRITMYPTPANDELIIKVPYGYENAPIAIFNLQGKQVFNGLLKTLHNHINISSINSGIYNILISNGSKTLSGKFIKR